MQSGMAWHSCGHSIARPSSHVVLHDCWQACRGFKYIVHDSASLEAIETTYTAIQCECTCTLGEKVHEHKHTILTLQYTTQYIILSQRTARDNHHNTIV